MKYSTTTPPDGAQASWTATISRWCEPLTSCWTRRSSDASPLARKNISWPLGRTSSELAIDDSDEKVDSNPSLIYQPPTFQPEPKATFDPYALPADTMRHRIHTRKDSVSSRTVLAKRDRSQSTTSSRRPLISGPTDFRHLTAAASAFPFANMSLRPMENRPRSFRPLELSICLPDNKLSPLLPYFDMHNGREIPHTAHPRSSQIIWHQRSHSAMSFHVPRKPLPQAMRHAVDADTEAPAIPPRSQARPRAYTSGEVDMIKHRVASAMIDLDKLQEQIDSVEERKSICLANSRPTTPHSPYRTWSMAAQSFANLEPMPSIPALPPVAPSFAERLNSDADRPQTTPVELPGDMPSEPKVIGKGASTFASPPNGDREEVPLAPPLPLVLRPPLRKKKSFSQVSSWLFQGHDRNVSLDSVTNAPRPVKDSEGFYQVSQPAVIHRRSFDSLGSVSTWDSDEESRTVPTTEWSPASSQDARLETKFPPRQDSIGRMNTFGSRVSSRASRGRSQSARRTALPIA